MTGVIAHAGTVVGTTADTVIVRIHDGADKCGGCSIKFMCNGAGDDNPRIKVPVRHGEKFACGEEVRLFISDSKQYSATLIALVLPCIALAARSRTCRAGWSRRGIERLGGTAFCIALFHCAVHDAQARQQKVYMDH